MILNKFAYIALIVCFAVSSVFAQRIRFDLKLKTSSYVVGEDIAVTVSISNLGAQPLVIDDFPEYKDHRLFFEIFHEEHVFLPKLRDGKIITDLNLEEKEGEAFDIILSEWYKLLDPGHYMVRAVLICNDRRYETKTQSFDIVPGIELAKVVQTVRGSHPFERKISLVYWNRDGKQLAFVRATDIDSGAIMKTLSLGSIILVRRPTIVPNGSDGYYIYRQATSDILMRTELVSNEKGIILKRQQQKLDSSSDPLVDALRLGAEDNSGKK